MHSNDKCNYYELSLSPLVEWLIESCLCLDSCDKNRLIRFLQWVRNVFLFSMCLFLMGDNKCKSSKTCDSIRIFLIFLEKKSWCYYVAIVALRRTMKMLSALSSVFFLLLQCQMTGLLIIGIFIFLHMLFFLQCWQFKCFNSWLYYQMLIYLHDKWEYGSKTFVLQLLDIHFTHNWTWHFLNPFQDIA